MEQQLDINQVSPDQVFEQMPTFFQADRAAGTNANIQFDLSGDQGGQWWIKIADGQATSGKGTVENPNLTLTADARDWVKIAFGQMDPTAAFMGGKLKIKGDMGLAIKFQSLFRRPTNEELQSYSTQSTSGNGETPSQ
jgi:putative sterol carrier protein